MGVRLCPKVKDTASEIERDFRMAPSSILAKFALILRSNCGDVNWMRIKTKVYNCTYGQSSERPSGKLYHGVTVLPPLRELPNRLPSLGPPLGGLPTYEFITVLGRKDL